MAKFKALNLFGKFFKKKNIPKGKDTSTRSPRGFTFSSLWRKKKASPTDGPRPNRSGPKLLKVISSVIKRSKAERPKSAGNGDGKEDPPVDHELVLQSSDIDEATASSDNVIEHDVCDSSLSIPTEYPGPLVATTYQQEVNEVVTLNVDTESLDWDDLSTIKSSTSSLTTVTELSDFWDLSTIESSSLTTVMELTDDEVPRTVDKGEYSYGKAMDQEQLQITQEGDVAGQDDDVSMWNWLWMIAVAVTFILLL